MRHYMSVGALAGFSAGLFMGFYIWFGYQANLFAYNPFLVLSSVLLPDELAVTYVGVITSIVVHLFIAAGIGALFAFFVPRKHTVLWGVGLGLLLQLFFGALVTPAFTFAPPFWEMDMSSMLFSLSQRLVFGVTLGYLYGLWWIRHEDRRKTLG